MSSCLTSNKDTVCEEAPIYACFFLSDVCLFKNFVTEDRHVSKDTSHHKCTLLQHRNFENYILLLKEKKT